MSNLVDAYRGAPAPARAAARTIAAAALVYPMVKFIEIDGAHPLETLTSLLAWATMFAHTHTVYKTARAALGRATAVPVVALMWAACFTLAVAVDARCLRGAATCDALDLTAAASTAAGIPVAALMLISPVLAVRFAIRHLREAWGRR